MTNPEEISKILGEIIRERRVKLDISQEKFAELCNVHRTYISQIERGLKSISLKVLFALAENLNTYPSELLEEVQKRIKK